MHFLSRGRESSFALLLTSAIMLIRIGLGTFGLFCDMAEKMLVPLEIGVTSSPPSRRISNLRFFIGGSNEGIGRIECSVCLAVLLELLVEIGVSLSLSLSNKSMTSVGDGRLAFEALLSPDVPNPAGFPLNPDANPAIAVAPATLLSKLVAMGVIVVRLWPPNRLVPPLIKEIFSFSNGFGAVPTGEFGTLPCGLRSFFIRTCRREEVFDGVFDGVGGLVDEVLIETVPLVGHTDTSLIVRSGSVFIGRFNGNSVALMLFS